jgi:hypothetical protein
MAARTIQDPRDRLATILVAPLMTCSARLPVYALLIAAFIPEQAVGPFNLQGLVLFGLYAAGILSAMAVAYVMKWARRDHSEHALLLELPSYRLPNPRDILIGLWERGGIFLKQVMAYVQEREPDADRIVVITDEQDTGRENPRSVVPYAPGYMINVASARNGIGYGNWTHIDGFSESAIRYMIEAEKAEIVKGKGVLPGAGGDNGI